MHGDDTPLVKREHRAGSLEQLDLLRIASRRGRLWAEEDRALENGVVGKRLLAFHPEVIRWIEQDIHRPGAPGRKPSQVHLGRNPLQPKLVLERFRELAQRVALLRGHHEDHLGHAAILAVDSLRGHTGSLS